MLLLICSALISGSEVALFSLTPSNLYDSNLKQPKTTSIIQRLLNKPKKLLATILVANNFLNIGIVLLFDTLGNYFFNNFNTVLWGWLNLRFVIEVGLITLTILLFGEILPKIYANRNSISFSNFMAYPLSFLDKILYFINSPMRYVTIKMHNQFGSQKPTINVDQLSRALEITSTKETSSEEKRILQGIVSFGNTEAKQVMKPRMDIFSVKSDESFLKLLSLITEKGHSRVPVFEESIDKIIGVLYIKDLIPYLNQKNYNWQQLIRKPMFVPENKKLDDLLTEFQEKKNHLAIIVDEYGGTSGLLTMDDIIREIVGHINDEYDDNNNLNYTKINNNTYLFEGRIHLKDFFKITKIKETEELNAIKGEAETLAGFMLEISNNFPRKGDLIKFQNYQFNIESTDHKRIKKIKFTILNNA